MSGELLVFITCYLVQKHLLLQSLLCFFPGSPVGKKSTCNAGDPSSIPGSGRSTGKRIGYPIQYSWASLVAQLVKNPPATWVQSLGWEDPLQKRKATQFQYSGLEDPMHCIVHGVAKSQTRLNHFHSCAFMVHMENWHQRGAGVCPNTTSNHCGNQNAAVLMPGGDSLQHTSLPLGKTVFPSSVALCLQSRKVIDIISSNLNTFLGE